MTTSPKDIDPMLRRLLMLAALPLAPAGALANDTTANFGVGGLVFAESADIAMRSEDLSLSLDEVRVAYVFRNISAEPVTTTVAFPVPEIAWDPYGNVSIPSLEGDDPLDFSTRVDGQPVELTVAEKALLAGTDVTERLEALGVPLKPWSDRTVAALDALPQDEQDALVSAGIAEVQEYDIGQGMERHLAPLWSWSGTYTREQTFPPGVDVAVEHRYRPSVGGAVGTLLHSDDPAYAQDVARMRERYCIDDAFMAAVKKRTAAFLARPGMENYGYGFSENWVDYVLTTGANWAEPIGAFRLTIDKGAPENLVSFCESGVRKTSPTTFEVAHEDFTPTRDLAVLVLVPADAPLDEAR